MRNAGATSVSFDGVEVQFGEAPAEEVESEDEVDGVPLTNAIDDKWESVKAAQEDVSEPKRTQPDLMEWYSEQPLQTPG